MLVIGILARPVMIGQVWRYNKERGTGIIVGHDKRQYSFSKKDIPGTVDLKEGNMVEFTVEGARALQIKLLVSPPNP